jgi:hypothetical protein
MWSIPQALGEFTWMLGDDDLPIAEAVSDLIAYCSTGEIDVMAWNMRNTSPTSEVTSWSKILSYRDVLPMKYSEFLLRMGFWSVPAGISLTVFRTSLITDQIIGDIQLIGSPIYSHVSVFALAFRDASFAFINRDLVYYRTNAHDVKQDGKHWHEYAKNTGNFYRYPWTLGFLRQIKYLEMQNAIPSNYLQKALDITHFNVRFMLLDSVIDLFLEQVISDINGDSKQKISDSEMIEILQELSIRDFVHADLWKTIQVLHIKKSKNLLIRSHDAARLHVARFRLRDEQSMFPFERFFTGISKGNLNFSTPLGIIAIKPGECMSNNLEMKDVLHSLLLGIELPPEFGSKPSTVSVQEREMLENSVSLGNEVMKASVYSRIQRRVTYRLVIFYLLPKTVRTLVKKNYRKFFKSSISKRIRG